MVSRCSAVGASFTSGGYFGTPVAAALPVDLYGPFDSGAILDTQKFSPQLTDAGELHPVTSLRYSATTTSRRGRRCRSSKA